ncbi:MAG TPA: hypothetical protein VKD45_12450 [Hyphomicrobiaceae bacterium]|nr:hypothetical protein [Hyphomicrobiaceae bacterium]
MGQLADYVSHKQVKAGKIISAEKDVATDRWIVTVEDANGAPAEVDCPPDIFARGSPSFQQLEGAYLVLYEDGYKSWSPAGVFESGYTRLPAEGAAA